MSYKPGDKVWVTVTINNPYLPAGDLPAIVLSGVVPPYQPRMLAKWPGAWREIEVEGHPSPYGIYRAPEAILRPRHDPYEGDQAGSWDTTPLFNPTKETQNV